MAKKKESPIENRRMSFRESVSPGDCDAVYRIVSSSGFFSEEEMAIAVELVQERLDRGLLSGYHFLLAETQKKVAGYSCYGPIPATKDRYDIYWIAVDEGFRKTGLGE
ncbi:MAG: GNAT family N-acetyltransferase [Deltaproteobacteria bacterium]|nr:GNAT family N-acetyltransferase [Deltaproteobacteria bacterium]